MADFNHWFSLFPVKLMIKMDESQITAWLLEGNVSIPYQVPGRTSLYDGESRQGQQMEYVAGDGGLATL